MNNLSIAFLVVNSVIIIMAPRRWAPLPLLVGTCYMTLAQGLNFGPFSFPIIRMLILSGLIRVFIRREKLSGNLNGMDKLLMTWAAIALLSSFFHEDPSTAFVFRLGMAYNICGIYFLIRLFCRSIDDLRVLCRSIAILLLPVAVEMLYEKFAAYNLFYFFGGVSANPVIRDGSIRAQGPFAHPILAGTVGAVCMPILFGIWNTHRKAAITGLIACSTMIATCSSSGPILSALAGLGALIIWQYRHRMKLFRWMAIIGYIGLSVVMKAPTYYIIARIGPIGASTGWHRARLIESAIEHLDEWWLGGTDYTRHWMPTGVSWSTQHTDITNYYLKMGVLGGLPLMFLLILLFCTGFAYVGKIIQLGEDMHLNSKFLIWTLGASLFAQAATCISVSYFDQSFLFLYLTLASISSSRSAITMKKKSSPAMLVGTGSPKRKAGSGKAS